MEARDAAEHGVTAGDSIRVVSAHGDLVAPARPSPHLTRGTVVVPANAPGARSNALIAADDPMPRVSVEKA
jgi:anaerobic selenocysteine-containing dehydrogenase